jgi:hypothetical protein
MTTSEALHWEEPLWDEPEFAALLERLVATFAPRLFALAEEAGERLDGRIVAWGMAFKDHAGVVQVDRTSRGRFVSADNAREMFSFSHRGKIRLVWYKPECAIRYDDAT